MESFDSVLAVLFFPIIYSLYFLGDYLYKKLKKRKIKYNKDVKFEEIYSKIKNGELEKAEKVREKKTKKEISRNVYCLIAFLVLWLLSIIFNKVSLKLREITIFGLWGVMLLWIVTFAINIQTEIDEDIEDNKNFFEDFLKLYNKDYIYKLDIEDSEHLKLRDEYIEMQFSIGKEGKFDLLNVQNCIYGNIDSTTKMSLYDISVELVNGDYSYITEGKYSEFKKEYKSGSIFKGIYIILDTERKIPTNIRITKNKYIQRKNKVELDNNEFEKYFDVNSEDENLAVRILTADVMQMLVDFYKKYNIVFEIVFREKKIYINLHIPEPFIVPEYELIRKKQIYRYYAILEFTTKLSKEINKALNGIEL